MENEILHFSCRKSSIFRAIAEVRTGLSPCLGTQLTARLLHVEDFPERAVRVSYDVERLTGA